MAIKTKPAGKIMFLLLFIGLAIGGYKIYRDKHPSIVTAKDTPIADVPESTQILKISGSNTIGDILAPALVKGYMESTGYSDVQIINSGKEEKAIIGTKNGKKDRINIEAHGTSTGLTLLNNNTTDICMASSPAPKGEYEEHVIGLDGIAIITSRSNSINSILMKDIPSTFSNGSIKIYRMDDNSGTYKVFKEMAMAGRDISSSSKQFSSATELVNAVSSDNTGMGFVSYTFINSGNIKAIPISLSAGLPSIIPNALTIQSEKYPLCRRLYMYLGKNNNTISKDLLKYIESTDGQKIVENNGFINLDININNNNENPIAMPNDPPEYSNLINSLKKITTEFRFEFGSQNLDTRALADVTRLISYLAQSENRKKKLVLVGFTDNVGDPAKNISLSIQRANAVKQVLEANGASVRQVLGFGPARPVRGNDNEEDRANNRRVEIWLTN